MKRSVSIILLTMICLLQVSINDASAATKEEIDLDVKNALELFDEIKGSDNVLKKAKGLLVFPIVLKAGFGLGGEYGEGALLVKGKTIGYYNTAAASIGFQIGAQKKTIIIAFLDKDALKKFEASEGWKIGADASIAVVAVGAGGAIDSASLNEPVVAVVLGQKGLMVNLTLEGAKISKIKK